MKKQWINKWALLRLAVLLIVLAGLTVPMVSMPGRSFQDALPALTPDEMVLRDELRRDVEVLSVQIGERNIEWRNELDAAAAFIEKEFTHAGYSVEKQEYIVSGVPCNNLIAELRGTSTPERIVAIGAHYDSVPACPAANDNASGVAATLALARRFAGRPQASTIRFIAFVNEEPPYFQTEQMGSLVYAKACKARGDRIEAMFSLETIGCYSDAEKSQSYPWPLNLIYPSTGNFIGFIGNFRHRSLVAKTVESFRRHAPFPAEGAAVPSVVPGVSWSDHWSFWQCGYPALMVTDTAPFRYVYYHSTDDTLDKLDFDRMARVISGMEKVVAEMGNQ